MGTIKDGQEPPEEYWNDDYELPSRSGSSERLLNGISIKDLCDGKEVMFEIAKDGGDDALEEDGIPGDIRHYDPKSLRENRGAPPLNTSFEEIASKMTNITEDGMVKKQMISSGSGKTVSDHAYVTVHYNLYKESCELPFDSTYLRNRPEKFRLDQGEAILGLELAIKSMKKHENSMFFIRWEVAFGALGCPDRIGKKCNIVADVTLVNFEEVDPEHEIASSGEISRIDFSRFLSRAKQSLCNGSDEFVKGDVKAAVRSYRNGLKILNSLHLADEVQESQMLKHKMKCLVNLAVCYNKLGKPEQACVCCQEALSIDSRSVKANFHYGRANIALSNFTSAKRFLLRADKLKPNDKEINKEIKKLNDKKALYELNDKAFWTKAFEGGEKEEKEEKEEKVETEETTEGEVPPSLKDFEKSLRTSLEKCIKEEKPYILPLPLLSGEILICDEVASQMKLQLEKQSHFYAFKRPKDKSEKCSE